MNTEEKILALLEQMNARMENLESGQAALEGRIERINGDLKFTNLGLRNLESKQAAFEGRMGRFEAALAELQSTQSKMQEDISSINLTLELDVDKRFKAISEGQEAIEKRLDTLDEVKELAEETRDRVDAIHAAVVQHSATITERKQAK